MKVTSILSRITSTVAFFLFLALIGTTLHAQQRMTIQATARGTGTQLGQSVNINIIINQFSTDDDQRALVDAFLKSGNEGMVDALTRMKEKGRISLPATVGNSVMYIRELPAANGRRIRLLTDRNIRFAELRNSTRSADYSIGAIELTLTADGKKSSGTFLPACKIKLNKKNEIEIEAFQNPWTLMNIMVHTDNKE